MKEDESGSRHFRFPRSNSRPVLRGSLGRERGVFGASMGMGESRRDSSSAEMSDSEPWVESRRRYIFQVILISHSMDCCCFARSSFKDFTRETRPRLSSRPALVTGDGVEG